MITGQREELTFRHFRGYDARRTLIFPEGRDLQQAVGDGLLLDARDLRFTADGRAYWHRDQLKVKSPTGAGTPICITEFANDTVDQLLYFRSDGTMHRLACAWSDVPTQWEFGYELFSAGTWVQAATSLPTAGRFGFASVRNRLIVCGGVSSGFSTGMATKVWDGATLSNIGIATPTTPAAPAAHSGAGDALIAGTYSYRVSFGNADYESLCGPIADVILEKRAASAEIKPLAHDIDIVHGDAFVIDGITYTFVDYAHAWTELHPYEVVIKGTGPMYQNYTMAGLCRMIADGCNEIGYVGGVLGTVYTPPHETVRAVRDVPTDWDTGSPWEKSTLVLWAREAGTDGNTITLSENTSNARLNVTGATLSGGDSLGHVDVVSIPLGPAGTTKRKLYRAHTPSIIPGNRGDTFLYLHTISDNSTVTYADNTPQMDLSEVYDPKGAIPPRGDYLCLHRERLFMAGVCRTSESYQESRVVAASPGGAVRTSNVVTITVTVGHNLVVGDPVTVAGVVPVGATDFNGTFTVASVPTGTTFTYAQTAANDTGGGGTATYGIYTANLQNILFYSELDEPYSWPNVNQITVGSSAPIVGLASWHEQLLIFKTDSVWVLTGAVEGDFNLYQVPGAGGAIGCHVATSPHGVLWAGHQGWMLYRDAKVGLVVQYQEPVTYTDTPPALTAPSATAKYPCVCYHAGRFHIVLGTHTLSWQPDKDVWEVARRDCSAVGLRAFEGDAYRSHVLAYARWGVIATGDYYVTVFDGTYMPATPTYGHYGDTEGSGDDQFYGNIRIELPPVPAPPGEMIVPLEVWISGSWTTPGDGADDLYLFIFTDGSDAWTQVGKLTANGRRGIPASYSRAVLRLALSGAECKLFRVSAVRLVYQRRAARG